MPYVQCGDGALYYLAPKVLVVGVTSELRERVCVLGLGERYGCMSVRVNRGCGRDMFMCCCVSL